MRSTSLLGLSILGLGLFACRSNSSSGDDDTQPDAPVKQTIQDVQNDSMPVGTPVALDGVIITAIDTFGAKTGDFWIEEPSGGPFSGVHVFGAPTSVVAALHVGDIVSLSGAVKDEFALDSDTSGRTVTELEAPKGGMMTVTKTGSGAVPAPMVVDALMIGQLPTQAARDAQWEMWEGVLITLNNVEEFNKAIAVPSSTNPDPTLQNFDVTGGAVVESSLAAFPTGLAANTCLASVTGVVDYFFDYLVLPLATTDVTTGGTGCATENTAAACSDGVDNDGNGFSDCADNGCIVGVATCRAVTTIPAIQAATPTGGIELDDVFVMAVSGNNFWISTTPAAAATQGVFVFNSATLDPAVVAGKKVTIIGTVQEFNDDTAGGTLTEVRPLSIVVSADAAVAVTPEIDKTVAQLVDPTTAAMFESVFVTLTKVNITTVGVQTNGFVATAVQNGTTFHIGTDILHLVAGTDEGCYDSLNGFWSNLEAPNAKATTKPNEVGFIPLSPLPAKGSGCN